MNRGFFSLSDGCHGNQENSVFFAFTIATNQKNKKCIHFMHFTILNNLWEFQSKPKSSYWEKMLPMPNLKFWEKWPQLSQLAKYETFCDKIKTAWCKNIKNLNLTYLSSILHFYTPLKYQKTKRFSYLWGYKEFNTAKMSQKRMKIKLSNIWLDLIKSWLYWMLDNLSYQFKSMLHFYTPTPKYQLIKSFLMFSVSKEM